MWRVAGIAKGKGGQRAATCMGIQPRKSSADGFLSLPLHI